MNVQPHVHEVQVTRWRSSYNMDLEYGDQRSTYYVFLKIDWWIRRRLRAKLRRLIRRHDRESRRAGYAPAERVLKEFALQDGRWGSDQ